MPEHVLAHGLADIHCAPADKPAATRARLPQQACLGRVIDGVHHHRGGAQALRGASELDEEQNRQCERDRQEQWIGQDG